MAVEQNRQGQEGIWHMCVKTQTSERRETHDGHHRGGVAGGASCATRMLLQNGFKARTLAGGACCCELTKRRFGGLDRNRQRSRAIFDRMSLRSWIHCDCL